MADNPQHVVGEWTQWLLTMSNPFEHFRLNFNYTIN